MIEIIKLAHFGTEKYYILPFIPESTLMVGFKCLSARCLGLHGIISQKNLLLVPISGTFEKIIVMSKNTSISLGDHFKDFVSKKV